MNEKVLPKTTQKLPNGTEKPPSKGRIWLSTTWGFCMSVAKVFPKTTQKLSNGTKKPPSKGTK